MSININYDTMNMKDLRDEIVAMLLSYDECHISNDFLMTEPFYKICYEVEEFAATICGALAIFAIDNNEVANCPYELWDSCYTNKSFGDVCYLYIKNEDGDFIRFWE